MSTTAGLRTPDGPTRKFPKPRARQLGESSQAQNSRNTGVMLSTVSSARMKQIKLEVRPILPRLGLVATGCGFGRRRIRQGRCGG